MRLLVPAIVIGVLAVIAVAVARHLSPSTSVRDRPIEAGAPAQVSVMASFDRSIDGELHGLELDLSRGFRFDPRAAATCKLAQARAEKCPVASRIGSGSGTILVHGLYLPRTKYDVKVALDLIAPPRRGDLAGVALDIHEPQSQLAVLLLGDVKETTNGPYGVTLHFSRTRPQLPYKLTLSGLSISLAAQRTSGSQTYNLLTNPRSCSPSGWPLLVAIISDNTTKRFGAISPCFGHP
jgi:hypothetical protein